MEGQIRELIRQKIVDSLAAPVPAFTRRDVWLPAVPGKAVGAAMRAYRRDARVGGALTFGMNAVVCGLPAQPQVANGASELFGQIFGVLGVHVRSAVGVSVLPLDAPVELELVVEASAAAF